MPNFPHELISHVQISTRSAAGLSGYESSDPTLPAMPSLSAAIAALDPSSPYLRCENCKGRLLRGLQSNICVYCGRRHQNDVAPEPISFTSTVGYQWLLRPLRLDGSETVKQLTNESEQVQGPGSPKVDTLLSDFLNFRIDWPTAKEEQKDTSFSNNHPKESNTPLSLTGLAPDNFFFKSKRDSFSDSSIAQPEKHEVAVLDNQNLFHNVQSSGPAGSSSTGKNSEAFSEWEADFQFADSDKQHDVSNDIMGPTSDSGNKFHDSQSFDLSAHMDSVFGPGKDLNDEKPKDTPTAAQELNYSISDDLCNNVSSNESQLVGFFDATGEAKTNHNLENSNVSTSVDLFQDFQWQSSDMNLTENKAMDKEHSTTNNDSFDEWNDFTDSTSLQGSSQNAWIGSDSQPSTSDKKASDIDLFSPDNEFEESDFGSFSRPNLSSASTGNITSPTEVNANLSENPDSNRLIDGSSLSNESGQFASNANASGKSTHTPDDDVKMLISEMHDLSFMLKTDLSIPSASDSASQN